MRRTSLLVSSFVGGCQKVSDSVTHLLVRVGCGTALLGRLCASLRDLWATALRRGGRGLRGTSLLVRGRLSAVCGVRDRGQLAKVLRHSVNRVRHVDDDLDRLRAGTRLMESRGQRLKVGNDVHCK